MKKAFVLVVGLLLAGCAGHSSVVQTMADGVVVKYDSAYSSIVEATATAEEACAKDGRHAEQGADEFQGNDTHLVTFKCVK